MNGMGTQDEAPCAGLIQSKNRYRVQDQNLILTENKNFELE